MVFDRKSVFSRFFHVAAVPLYINKFLLVTVRVSQQCSISRDTILQYVFASNNFHNTFSNALHCEERKKPL